MWKDYINSIGGICIDGNKASDGSCTNRKKVCLKLVLLEGDTDQNVICSSIKTWIEGISSLSDDKKPHILISPIGYSETECTLNKVRDQQDFKILTIGGYSIDDDFYRTTPTIGYTPYIIIILFIYIYFRLVRIDYKHKGLYEVLTSKYKVKSLFIIGDNTLQSDKVDEITAFINLFDNDENNQINIIQLRCSNSMNLISGKSCSADEDCNTGETCTFPRVNFNTPIRYKAIDDLKSWMKYIMGLKPDALFIASGSNTVNYIKIIKEIQYTPRIVIGLDYHNTIESIYYNFLLLKIDSLNNGENSLYYHASTMFTGTMGYGTSGMYIGTSTDYVSLLESKLRSK